MMINKRPDLTSEQFRHHYETVHAPLVERLMPYYSAYRRKYVDGGVRSGREFDCDVFTELEFATASDYDAWLANLDRQEVLEQIRADEANFLEAGATRLWAVSTFSSDFSGRQTNESKA